MKNLLFILFLFLCINNLSAQSVAKKIANTSGHLDSTNNSLNSASNTINGTSGAITNTANAVKNLGTVFGIHGGKKNKPQEQAVTKDSLAGFNPITISISGINYDKLEITQDSIQALQGVKSVDMNYNATGSTINVLYNGKTSQLWHSLSPAIKSMFEVQTQDATSITVQYKK